MWSNHGTNLIGANRVLQAFLTSKKTEKTTSALVKVLRGILFQSACGKLLLQRVVGNHKLNFEEMMTQIEACLNSLNSRPLGTVPHNDNNGIEW